MGDAPDSTPWIVWLIAMIAVPMITGVVSIVITLITRRDTKADLAEAREHLTATKTSVDQTLDQVQNTHSSNLRADLDEKFAQVREDIGGLHSETQDLRRDVTGIRTDARRDRRKLSDQEEVLEAHIAEVPTILKCAFAEHSTVCVLRREPNQEKEEN